MRALLFLVFAVALSSFAAQTNILDEEVRTLAVGSVEVIDLDFTPGTPAIGNKYVLEVRPGANPKQLRVIPIKKGTTSLAIPDGGGKVRRKFLFNFITNDLSPKAITVRKLMGSVPGVHVESVDEHIVIEGEISDPRHAERIRKLAKAYPEVLDLTTSSASLCDLCATCNEDKGGKKK